MERRRFAHTIRTMSGARSLTPEQNERIRAAINADLVPRYGDQTALAGPLGVSQSAISGFLKGRQGTSYLVARRAAALLGMPLDALLDGGTVATPMLISPDAWAKLREPALALVDIPAADREAFVDLVARTPLLLDESALTARDVADIAHSMYDIHLRARARVAR